MAAVNRDERAPPKKDAGRPGRTAQGDGGEDVRIPRPMLDACRSASLLIGGPGLRRLGITSALREEGRTSIALAMAIVQREDYGRTVALVDMDLERPSHSRRHGVEPWPGLAELSRGLASAQNVLQKVSDGLFVVTAGVLTSSAARTMAELVRLDTLTELERHVDVVVADLPPLLGGGPGAAGARAFPELVLVIRAGVTPVARIKEATEDLHCSPHVLLNAAHTSLPHWLRRLVGP